MATLQGPLIFLIWCLYDTDFGIQSQDIFALSLMLHLKWQIQDFPEKGALTPKGGTPTYYLANFSRKLHENEEILGQRGGARALAGPPP